MDFEMEVNIRRMAGILCGLCDSEICCADCPDCPIGDDARRLYEAGFRLHTYDNNSFNVSRDSLREIFLQFENCFAIQSGTWFFNYHKYLELKNMLLGDDL